MDFSRHLFIALLVSFLVVGCSETSIKVDPITPPLKFVRYDHAIKALNPLDILDSYIELESSEPALTKLYFKQLIPILKSSEPNAAAIKDFISNKHVINKLDTLSTFFDSLEPEEEAISAAMGYLKHYFPEASVPNIYALYGDFTYQAFIFESAKGSDAIGLCLDMFLGQDFNYKALDPKNPIFSDYLTKRYSREYIPKKVMELTVENLLGDLSGKRLIDHMIYQGKKLTIMEAIMPETEFNTIMEFSPQELQWCQNNELNIWSYFLDENLLFETNQQRISSYINEAPRSKGMPEESPSRTGTYIGYQIIKRYMDKKNISVSELLMSNDADKIFQTSKYKPSRK